MTGTGPEPGTRALTALSTARIDREGAAMSKATIDPVDITPPLPAWMRADQAANPLPPPTRPDPATLDIARNTLRSAFEAAYGEEDGRARFDDAPRLA